MVYQNLHCSQDYQSHPNEIETRKLEEQLQNLQKQLEQETKNKKMIFKNNNNNNNTNTEKETNHYYTNYFDKLPTYFPITAQSVVELYGEWHVYTNIDPEDYLPIEKVYYHYINKADFIPSFINYTKDFCDSYIASDIARISVASGMEYDNYYFFDMDTLHFKRIDSCNWISVFSSERYEDYAINPAAFCFKRGSEFIHSIVDEISKITEGNNERVQFGPAIFTETFHKYSHLQMTLLSNDNSVASFPTFRICYQNFFHPASKYHKTLPFLTSLYNTCTKFLQTERDYIGAPMCGA